MAEFLTTKGISLRLEGIIKNAKEFLVIISPYLRPNHLIKERLDEMGRLEVPIHVVCREAELRQDEKDWLSSHSIRTRFCEYIHAKCYMNEDEALLTSMNLYDASERNDEMGIVVSCGKDPELYENIKKEAWRLIGKRIYVGNLSYDTSDDDLRAAFEQFGDVVEAHIAIDRYTDQSPGVRLRRDAGRRAGAERYRGHERERPQRQDPQRQRGAA